MRRYRVYDTEFFRVAFAGSRLVGSQKFKTEEKDQILAIIRENEKYLFEILNFAPEKAKQMFFKSPVLFEKMTLQNFEMKHRTHYATTNILPPNVKWLNAPDMGGQTQLVCLSPNYKADIYRTISHEILHALINSFLEGINSQNKHFFLEAFTEFLSNLLFKLSTEKGTSIQKE